MALYSEMLLDAAKSVRLADDDAELLTDAEAVRYSVYLKNAISRFNNNPDISIGTEKTVVRSWSADEFSHFARIIRDDDSSLLRPVMERRANTPDYHGDSTGAAAISRMRANANGTFAVLAEVPQRLISATWNIGTPSLYYIFNEKQFFEVNRSERAVCYQVTNENEGILRITQPVPLLCIFDRALPFHFGIDNDMASAGSRQPYRKFNLLNIHADLPTSHIPYLITLIALELANGMKVDADMVETLEKQVAAQEKMLLRNNIAQKVNFSVTDRDYAFNWWNRRAYR